MVCRDERCTSAARYFSAPSDASVAHDRLHILLSGEITLMLDKEERTLKPLDCVIQRGTNHAWVNRGSEPALLMAVLVDDRRNLG